MGIQTDSESVPSSGRNWRINHEHNPGGGFIFQSDHSVTSGVSGPTYDLVVKLVREHGRYPLRLGPFEESL